MVHTSYTVVCMGLFFDGSQRSPNIYLHIQIRSQWISHGGFIPGYYPILIGIDQEADSVQIVFKILQ